MAAETGKPPYPSARPLTEAAVLVPVFRGRDGCLRIVLVRRGDGGAHAGEIAFPGGKREPGDAGLEDTARREACEEIGLGPERIEVAAQLPVEETAISRFRITPYLARINPPDAWKRCDGEIAEVIEASVAELALSASGGGGPPSCRVGPHRVWGATYRILRALLPRLESGEWSF